MQVRREIEVPASVDEVWRALTEPARLAEWFGRADGFEARAGAETIFRWGDGEARRAVVDEVDAGRLLAFRWADVAEPAAESRVEIELGEIEAGTRVTVTETALAASARIGEWSVAVAVLALLLGALALV